MKTTVLTVIFILALGVTVLPIKLAIAAPMGSAFTYQGRLIDANEPADGLYDLQLRLYDSLAGGTQVGSTLDANEVDVNDGYFTLLLEFGSAAAIFDGNARWLEIGVREGALEDPNVYTVLVPRQELTPTPYALYAANAPGGAIADNDWKVTGTNMFSMPVGNVGIGTTTPSKKLDVNGQARFDGELYARGATGIGLVDDAGNLGLWVEDGGNVGIGTTSPAEKLHVAGNLQTSGVVRVAGNIVELKAGFLAGNLRFQSDQLSFFGGTNGISLRDAGGSTKAVMLNNGNVGIGTTTPSKRLDVNGQGAFDGELYARDTTGIGLVDDAGGLGLWVEDGGNVGIGTKNPASDLHMPDGQARFGYDGGYPAMRIYNNKSSGDASVLNVESTEAGASSLTWVLWATTRKGRAGYFRKWDDDNQYAVYIYSPGSGSEGLYVHGRFAASGTKSGIIETSQGQEAIFAVEGPEVEIYCRGSARLKNGSAQVAFDRLFTEAISSTVEVAVTVTPIREWSALYVESTSTEGFDVRSADGEQNVKFHWMACGRRKGYETRPEVAVPDPAEEMSILAQKETEMNK